MNIGELVRTVSANDPDGDKITYSLKVSSPSASPRADLTLTHLCLSFTLLQSSPDSAKFKVLLNVGTVVVEQPLNRDVGDYNLTLIATDSGSPALSDEAQLIVSMTRNLNPPIFLSNYSVNVSEYAEIGRSVVRVEAEDADPSVSPSGQLTYELLPGASPGAVDYFAIGSFDDAQLITVNKSLKDYPADSMRFRVQVKDGGQPSKMAVAYVHVRYGSLQPLYDL